MNRELIMQTLFNFLQQPPVIFPFTADTAVDDVTLANVSDTTGLLVGMPINGPGVPDGATLATIAPTVTLSQPATDAGIASPLLQGFQTAGRRLQQAAEEADQPSMYLIDVAEEHPERESRKPYLVNIRCELWIYSTAGQDPDAVPATALNNLIGAVEQLLTPSGSQPGGGFQQRLGLEGVNSCRIEGEVQKEPAHTARLAHAIIPIRIQVASTTGG
jgi:hypothetical protein